MKAVQKLLLVLLLPSVLWSQIRTDPNSAVKPNSGKVIAPGCTQFVHPCSAQAAIAALADKTGPVTKEGTPVKDKNSKRGNRQK